jgi:diguanylate cyclase (GGDEF)-like protein
MFAQSISPGQPDPALLQKLALIDFVYLAVVGFIACLGLGAWLVPPVGHAYLGGWMPMRPQTALAALLCSLSLILTLPRFSGPAVRLGQVCGGLAGLVSLVALTEFLVHFSDGLTSFSTAHPARMPPHTSFAFLLLSVAAVLLRSRKGFASHLADACVCGFGLLVLIIVSGDLYGALRLFGNPPGIPVSLLTLLAMALLAFVAFTRRAEFGVFNTILRTGLGGKIARVVAPLALLVPFLPEPARVEAIRAGLMRAEYASAIVTSVVAMLGFAVLVFMAREIYDLEKKVRDLSVRDELTGLYNRRGFHLVAWQALRQARRSSLPFSVLFIDMENLAEINLSLGYRAGSESLTEMAELLQAAFRETDVVGRIGGAQFAMAGLFNRQAIATIVLRLKEAANYRNSNPGRPFSLLFSIGSVTSESSQGESLEELLARADQATHPERRSRPVRQE